MVCSNILFAYAMGKHGFGDNSNNCERFVAYYSLNHLVIDDTLFEYRACHGGISTNSQRIANQIDHITIRDRLRSSLLNASVKRSADISLERGDHLIVALSLITHCICKFSQEKRFSTAKVQYGPFSKPGQQVPWTACWEYCRLLSRHQMCSFVWWWWATSWKRAIR